MAVRMRQWLLDRADTVRFEPQDALADIGRRTGLVGVDAQVHLTADALADGADAVDVVLCRDAYLHLELVEAIAPHLPRLEADLAAVGRGDRPAVANVGPRLVKLRREQARHRRDRLV